MITLIAYELTAYGKLLLCLLVTAPAAAGRDPATYLLLDPGSSPGNIIAAGNAKCFLAKCAL